MMPKVSLYHGDCRKNDHSVYSLIIILLVYTASPPVTV